MNYRLSDHLVRLGHLAAIVDSGSINRAANLMGMTQPALTRSIMRLEEVLDVQLLRRTSKGVSPTEFAMVLLNRTRSVHALLARAEAEMDSLKGSLQTSIVLGSGPVTTYHILPAAVARLHKLFPDLRIQVIEGHTPALLDRLRAGEIDLVIGSRIDEKDNSDLAIDSLVREHIGVFASRSHPAAADGPHKLVDILANAKWVMPGQNIYLHRLIDAELRRRQVDWPRASVETTSIQTMRWLVREGAYLTISTSLVFATDLVDESVCAVKGDWSFPVVETVMYRGAEGPAPRVLSQLIRFLRQAVLSWPPAGK